LDLGCGHGGIVLAAEISPVGNQDGCSDAGGVTRTGIPQCEGLAGAITPSWWRGQCGDGVSRYCEDIGESAVQGRIQGWKRGEGNTEGEHRERGSGEFEESLGAEDMREAVEETPCDIEAEETSAVHLAPTAGQSLHEDLHPTTQTENKVES
jgi:hypothetical protein